MITSGTTGYYPNRALAAKAERMHGPGISPEIPVSEMRLAIPLTPRSAVSLKFRIKNFISLLVTDGSLI